MPSLRHPEPPLADSRVALRAWRDEDIPWLARAFTGSARAAVHHRPESNTEADVRAFLLAQGPLLERRDIAIHGLLPGELWR